MNTSKIITPWLTENLESLHKQEEEIRTKSILEINGDLKLKDQLSMIQESLNLVFDLTKSYRNQTDDELTIQYIGIRFFNSIVSALKLLLSGYYQVSVIIQRDILETGFLLDYFLSDKSKIQDWKKSSNKNRLKKYGPAAIRKALDQRDGFKEKQREHIYKLLCEYAAHPTYTGFKLVAPKGLGEIGPFLDANYLKATIGELSLRIPLFSITYLSHFENLPPEFLKIRTEYLVKVKKWSQKYLKTDLCHIDAEGLKKQVDELLTS